MGILKEALFAFRGRRFVEWLFMERPQLLVISGMGFYALIYLQYKYDFIARWQGQNPYNDFSYVKQDAEQKRARLAALSSANSSPGSSSQSSSSSTGVN